LPVSEKQYPKIEADTIPKYLKASKERWGDQVYMRRKDLGIWRRYSWEEVYEEVRAFSLGLMELGLKPGETVAISGENEPEFFWAEYAAQAAGGKVVCLYPDSVPQEVQYILDNSDAVYFVAEDQEQVDKVLEIKDQLPNLRKCIYWDPRSMWQYQDPFLMLFADVQESGRLYGEKHPDLFEKRMAEGKGNDIAVLSYTSGTTGLPKGVIFSHDYLIDNAFRLITSVHFRPFTRYLSYISPAWGTEQYFLVIGLIMPFIYNFPEEPETVMGNIRELGAEALVFGPRQWESFASTVQARMFDAGPIRRLFYKAGMKVGMEVAAERTEGVKTNIFYRLLHPLAEQFILMPIRDNLGLRKSYYVLNGGAPAAPDVFRFFHAMGVKLQNAYGTTEMGLLTHQMGDRFEVETLGKWLNVHPSFGTPLEWKIDQNGELLVRGGTGFIGYYKNQEATAKAMKEGWYRTGDSVAMKGDEEVVFLDRVSDLRKLSSGYLFPPQYIETRLRFSPFVKDAMILGDETKPFVAVLINIDAETVGRWAERKGISYSTFPDLSQKAGVCELIQKEIEGVNEVLEDASRVKRFVNLPKEFDPDEAELTRTRKLRRSFLEERYEGLIKAIYSGNENFVSEVPVKYRDGRTGVMKTNIQIINVP